MAKNIRNFDKFISEMKRETVSFTIFGKTYEIEKRIPAIIPLELSKYDDEDGIPTRILAKSAYAIFGKAIIDELCKHPDFDFKVLNELLKWAFEVINGNDAGPVELTEDDTAAPERKN